MTLIELIENRKNTYNPEEDREHNANDFYVGYSTGWQGAYDDLLRILKSNDADADNWIVNFKSSVR